MTRKPRIAHLAGPTATIQNTPPLVTSNKARLKHGLPPRASATGAEPYGLRQNKIRRITSAFCHTISEVKEFKSLRVKKKLREFFFTLTHFQF